MGENGAVEGVGNGVAYLAACVTVPRAHPLAAATRPRAGGGHERLRPSGDVYGDGKQRVPARLNAGEKPNRSEGLWPASAPPPSRCGAPRIPSPSTHQTLPDPGGQRDVQYIGLPVLVFGEAPVTDVVARVVESERFAETRLRYPSLPGGAATQVGFGAAAEGPAGARGGAHPGHGAGGGRQTCPSRTRRGQHHHLRGGLPPHLPLPRRPVHPVLRRPAPAAVEPEQAYALVLSLHGVGVEGTARPAPTRPRTGPT
ncbi:MAG: hypothetical protein R3F43_09185 [bacterium]